MKRFVILLAVSSLLLIPSCTRDSQQTQAVTKVQTSQNITVATVNGESVTQAETEYFKKRLRSDVINDFSAEYGITDFSDFWNTEYGGITPMEELENRALQQAIASKILLMQMKKYKIYESTDYSYFKNLAEVYNQSHKGKSNVGLNTIDTDSFYTYYIETGEMELKNRLAKDVLMPTQEQIETYLNSHSGVTQEGAITALAEEAYNTYLSELIAEAIVITQNP